MVLRHHIIVGQAELRGFVVAGFLFAGFFVAVVIAYGCTEYMLARIDPICSRNLNVILTANLLSFAFVWLSSMTVLLASGAQYCQLATIAIAGAQTIWLAQHLWSYYRNHPRLRFEN
jgi:hypothetical protein